MGLSLHRCCASSAWNSQSTGAAGSYKRVDDLLRVIFFRCDGLLCKKKYKNSIGTAFYFANKSGTCSHKSFVSIFLVLCFITIVKTIKHSF